MKSKRRELTREEERRLAKYEVFVRHHGVPMTRRQLLASGLKAGAGFLMMPSLIEILAHSGVAQAAEVCAAAKTLPGLIVINLNGGASLAGNMVMKDRNNQYLSTYGAVGLGSPANLTMRKEFGPGGPDFASISGVLAGILQTTTPETRANTAALGICVASQDDTANNKFDPSGLMAKVKEGLFLPVLGRNRNQPAMAAKPASLQVGSVGDIEAAIGVQGSIAQMTAAQKSKLFTTIDKLSETQGRKLASQTSGKAFSELVKEATGMNAELVGNANSGIDPRQETGLAGVWNFNNNGELRDAAVVYNALKGNATMGYIEMGGYDYHAQGRANQDTDDTAAGVKIGQVLQTASVLSLPVAVMVTSDGSVGHEISNIPGTAPTSDSGQHGMAYMFFYDPLRRPENSGSQVGAFRASGDRIGVDESSPIGANPELATVAMMANYLSFSGQPGMIETIAPRVFSEEQLPQIIKVHKGS